MKKVLATAIVATTLAFGSGCSTAVSQDTKAAAAQQSSYARDGFETRMEDGRLWIFQTASKDLAKFDEHGELAKHVIRPGAGPGRITVKAPDTETLDAYLLSRPGFVTRIEDGRLWVFKSGSDEFKKFTEHGELAKHIIRPGAGPNGMTVKSPDAETLDAYLTALK